MQVRKNKKIIAFYAAMWILLAALLYEGAVSTESAKTSDMIGVHKASSQ